MLKRVVEVIGRFTRCPEMRISIQTKKRRPIEPHQKISGSLSCIKLMVTQIFSTLNLWQRETDVISLS